MIQFLAAEILTGNRGFSHQGVHSYGVFHRDAERGKHFEGPIM
jgi:hypothetical protein